MQATARGGLTGKARHNRHRNRAYRMYAQQMLEEYYEGDEPQERSRPIPLRGRAEFLPTADQWTQADSMIETNTQLELSLDPSNDTRESESPRAATAEPRAEQTPALDACVDLEAQECDTNRPDSQTEAPRPIVIPAPYWARPRASFQPQAGRRPQPTFDLRRFMYGCALGTAAAAAILLMANVIIH